MIQRILWINIDGCDISQNTMIEIDNDTGLDRVSYIYHEDEVRHYMGLILLRECLIREKAFKGFSIKKSVTGKPYLRDDNTMHFNISHSGKIVVCAISDSNIGIDIEEVRGYPDEVLNSIFLKNEKNYVLYSPNKEQAFFEIWTQKESFLKCCGEGICGINHTGCMVNNNTVINKFDKYWFKKVDIISDYVVTICSEINMDNLIIERFYYEQ